ncbi:MAG TPA: MFS transporter [Novosphingobium sp.]|nr:MFS transporter [Novosphingobium sp.]
MEDPRAIIAREPMHFRQKVTIGIATALNALDGFDVLSISFASPGISKDWNVTKQALGVVLSMELIGMGIGAFLLGLLCDRIGRRPTTLGCLVVMATGMALAANAHDVQMLSLFRLYTGLGIGGMLAATNAIAAECSNAQKRNLSVAIMVGGYPMGAVVGGFLASALLGATGHWQSVFTFGAGLTVLFLPLVWFLVPETIAFLVQKQPEGALAKINRTMVRQGRAPLAALPPRPAPAKGVALSRLFAPGLALVSVTLVVAYGLHMMTFYFLMKWIPKIVVDMGFAAPLAGGVLVWANVGGALGTITMSLLTQRFGVRGLLICQMIGGAVAVACFGSGVHTIAALSLIACFGGFFTTAATAGLYAVMAQSYPAELRGGGTGLVIGIGRIGAALGPIVAGALFQAHIPLQMVAVIMACGTLTGAVAIALLRYRETEIA